MKCFYLFFDFLNSVGAFFSNSLGANSVGAIFLNLAGANFAQTHFPKFCGCFLLVAHFSKFAGCFFHLLAYARKCQAVQFINIAQVVPHIYRNDFPLFALDISRL